MQTIHQTKAKGITVMALDAQHELREIKNKIIGNPDAKDSVANDASLTRCVPATVR